MFVRGHNSGQNIIVAKATKELYVGHDTMATNNAMHNIRANMIEVICFAPEVADSGKINAEHIAITLCFLRPCNENAVLCGVQQFSQFKGNDIMTAAHVREKGREMR